MESQQSAVERINLPTTSTCHLHVESPVKQLLTVKNIADAESLEYVQLTISTLIDRFDKSPRSELLPDIIKLMRNHMENAYVQMSCHQLIDQYSADKIGQSELPLGKSLIEVLLSDVKLHCHHSLVVEKFCSLLVEKIGVEREEIDLYLVMIDCLMEILCDAKNFDTDGATICIKTTQKWQTTVTRMKLTLWQKIACGEGLPTDQT